MTAHDDKTSQIAQTQGHNIHGHYITAPQPGLGSAVFKIVPNIRARGIELAVGMADSDRRTGEADLRQRLRALAGTPTTARRVLLVGDSMVAGAGSSDGSGFRGPLGDLLDRVDIEMVEVAAYGNGLTVATAAPLVTAALASGPPPDLAVVLIGTNDATWPAPGWPNPWQTATAALIDQILAAGPGVKVAVARISLSAPWADPVMADATVTARQAQVNGIISAICGTRPRTAVVPLDTLPPDWLTDGGWHPGDAGYLRYARQIFTVIEPWL